MGEIDDTNYFRKLARIDAPPREESVTEADPFDGRYGEHRTWIIEPRCKRVGQKWRANSYAERRPTEDGDDQGDALTFSDLGDYDTEPEAVTRAMTWTQQWIEENG
jgi:hypothetical protein